MGKFTYPCGCERRFGSAKFQRKHSKDHPDCPSKADSMATQSVKAAKRMSERFEKADKEGT